MKKYTIILALIILLVPTFFIGYQLGKTSIPSVEKIEGISNKQTGQPEKADFSLFWDAWHLIEKEYVERAHLNYQQMVYGAISGLVKSLDDPYSVFLEPQESKQFLDDMSGKFEGIGAEVGIRQGVLTIISPLEGNPAQKAGLRAGDKILKIDQNLTADLTIDQAVKLIRGPKGTSVTLLISRDGWEEAKEISIIRETIKIPIIRWEMKENKIAYIQLAQFTQNSPAEFRRVVLEILKKEPRGLIIDLRNNPGGYLEAAVDLASWFVDKGEIILVEDFGNGQQNEYRSKGYGHLANLPTIILINQGSASASEILAGALRDLKGIKIVGEKSFGKGSVQQLERLRDGSSLKITVAKWLTPAGISINQEGIVPDFEVELTAEDIDQMKDPQLDQALKLLGGK